MKKKNKYKLVDVICSVICLSLVVFVFVAWPKSSTVWKSSTKDNSPKVFSKLDGTEVLDDKTIGIIGVMVDNFPSMYPQAGLNSASVVYETLAEGDLTRFLAFYNASTSVEKVGPVRSARPYFVDWIQEYDALYMHCGGSEEALDKIKTVGIKDANEFYNGQYFWRDNSRDAPHNLFTNSADWQKMILEKNITLSNFGGWKFSVSSPVVATNASAIDILYFSNYIVGWKYDAQSGEYIRLVNNQEQFDGDKKISADNVVVQYVKMRVVDDVGRHEVFLDGSGDMRFLRDGKLVSGTWKKENNRTHFFDGNGLEVEFKPGNIWIQVVPLDTEIKITA